MQWIRGYGFLSCSAVSMLEIATLRSCDFTKQRSDPVLFLPKVQFPGPFFPMSQLPPEILIGVLQLVIAIFQFVFTLFAWQWSRHSQHHSIQVICEKQPSELLRGVVRVHEPVHNNRSTNKRLVALPPPSTTGAGDSLPEDSLRKLNPSIESSSSSKGNGQDNFREYIIRESSDSTGEA
ncbi:hypothetical protein GGR55DRAFT_158161 [Xylaria sp. FL0064]|nr:hypothetical protein GGR55DRAFT_158161 [Xylaria sp. FL0064]